MGNEYLFQMLAQQNIETLNGYGVKKIVTNCPHCFNCLKNEYAPLGGNYEVMHGTELVSRLIAEGRIRMETPVAQTISFHDPCYLGRYNGVYDAPRQILESIPGLKLQELPRSRERGLCCGAGGGRMWMEEKLGSRINQARMKEIAEAGTDAVGVSCPFCMVMIGNAKEEIGAYHPTLRRPRARPPVHGSLRALRSGSSPARLALDSPPGEGRGEGLSSRATAAAGTPSPSGRGSG